MVFSDLFFLFVFLPAFGLTYLAATWIDGERRKESDLVGEHTFGNAVLVAFSLIFYAWGEPVYVLLMIGCVVLNLQFLFWVIPIAACQLLAQSVCISPSSTWRPATAARTSACRRRPTAASWTSSPT